MNEPTIDSIAIGRFIKVYGLCIGQEARGAEIEFFLGAFRVKFTLPRLPLDADGEDVSLTHCEAGYVNATVPDKNVVGGKRFRFSVTQARLQISSHELRNGIKLDDYRALSRLMHMNLTSFIQSLLILRKWPSAR